MGDINIKLKSKSMPTINWTPVFTGQASEIRFRDGRFYLRIQSRVTFDLEGQEISCQGNIPISGEIIPFSGQLEFHWQTEGASHLKCTEEWLPELIDEV